MEELKLLLTAAGLELSVSDSGMVYGYGYRVDWECQAHSKSEIKTRIWLPSLWNNPLYTDSPQAVLEYLLENLPCSTN